MENDTYNSLTKQLIQKGIISGDSEFKFNDVQSNSEGIFKVGITDSVVENSNEVNTVKSQKRLNKFDLELLQNDNLDIPKTKLKIGKFDFLNILKQFSDNKTNKSISLFEKILFRLFPKLYQFKLAKELIKQLDELNIDIDSLLIKTIPYGENEIRYKEIVKFLKYANKIQAKLKANY